jgi:hypothetical protein
MLAFALLAALAAAPTAHSEPLGPGHFRLSLSGRLAGVEGAQAALLPEARRLCRGEPVRFGTFRFSKAEKPAEQSFEQELFCGTGRPSVAGAPLPPPDWKPSPADQQAVLAATYGYFAAKDRGRYSEAWGLLSDRMKATSPAAEWQESAAAFNARAGAVRGRRVTEITWYNNPPDAPQPGLYVAADYSADFEKLDFACGYVMWRLEPGGSFRVTREEQNTLGKEAATKLASIDRAPLRAQMGCKD